MPGPRLCGRAVGVGLALGHSRRDGRLGQLRVLLAHLLDRSRRSAVHQPRRALRLGVRVLLRRQVDVEVLMSDSHQDAEWVPGFDMFGTSRTPCPSRFAAAIATAALASALSGIAVSGWTEFIGPM